MMRLKATDLSKGYGSGQSRVLAVDGVSLEVAAGERLALTGASGSGKSTLLSLLAVLERPDAGSVSLDGETISTLPEAPLAALRGGRIGIVFQSFRLLPQLTALENVRLPLDLAGATDAGPRALRWLERVGLKARGSHLPGELSGGEQQRAALARALVSQPGLILADEPTGNLDSRNGALVGGLLFGLAREQGAALVLVTHETALARKADRVIVMKDGRVPGRRRGRP